METFYVLLILLVVTRVFGEIAVRMGQPALVGELLSGILLGAIVTRYSDTFPTLAHLSEDPVFTAITDLGVFFLMLLAGLEMHPKDITSESGGSFAVAISGLLLPLAAGFGLAWMFLPPSDVRIAQAMFVGTALAITAVPVAVRVLMDLGKLESKAGKMIVAAAVFDDVLSLILLGVLTALINTGGLPDLATFGRIAGQTVLFFAIVIVVGQYILPVLGRRLKHLMSDELEFSFLVLIALAFAVLAEAMHLHFILGAFVAGLFFGRRTIDEPTFEEVEKKVSAITTGFLAPIFFASIGFHLDVSAVTAIPLFLTLLIVVAFLTKLVGAGVPAYLVGLSKRESLALGMAMSARGAVELIIAGIALRAGLFDRPDPLPPVIANMFSAIVITTIVTTVAVPIALRQLLPRDDSS